MKYISMELDNIQLNSDTENASRRIVINFFYSDHGGDAQRGHEWMLRSLLYQLLCMRHDMWDSYRSKYENFKQQNPPHWHLELLMETFRVIKTKCRLPLTIYLLVDAMDESVKQKRDEILKLLSSICDFEGTLVMKVLVASRPLPRIADVLSKHITITLEDRTTADIVRFTSKRIDRINAILGINTTEVQHIHGMIVERSRGIFLWVKLVLDELEDIVRDGCSFSGMKIVLEGLPQDLDTFYAHMLKSRLPKIGTMYAETLWMLQWVAFSSRPLSLVELTEAVAVATSDSPEISLHMLREGRALSLDQANRMLASRCGGFLEVKNGIVQFIHQTVLDFIFNLPETSSFAILQKESTESIATTCVKYLKFINGEIKHKRDRWQHTGQETEDLTLHSEHLDFLKSSQLALLNYAAYAPEPIDRSCSDISRGNSIFTGLESARREFIQLMKETIQTAICFDRPEDIDLLLRNGVEIEREDTDAIGLFIENTTIDHYCFLACEGYSCFVGWLVRVCRWSVGQALQQASSKGHEAGMKLLLEFGVSDKDMMEALSKAAQKEQWGMVELLLKHGFKEDDTYKASYNMLQHTCAGSGDWTSRIIHHAASKGYNTAIRFLLDNNNNDKEATATSALHHAVRAGHDSTVMMLVGELHADKEARTTNGSTALHLAARAGYPSIVRMLVREFHADKEAKTSNGSTALHVAAGAGHDSTVLMLVGEFNAHKEARTTNGSTALHLAAGAGYPSIVRMLVREFHADKEAKTTNGFTALHLAAGAGHVSTVRMLVGEFNAHKEAKTNDGSTALHLTASAGHKSTFRMLVREFHADKEAKTTNGSTALHFAAAAGHQSTVQMLIEEFHALREAQTTNGRTALHLAASAGHDSIVRMLVEELHADKEARTTYRSTAINLARTGGHTSTAQLLTRKFGRNEKSKDNTG